MKTEIHFTLNGESIEHEVEVNKTLLKMIREDFDLTGAKEGCGAGECGACTVIMDGRAVNACLVLAVEAEGCDLLTIEGLSGDQNELDPLQSAFIENAALQCGYCTPGMIMTAKALLNENPHPTETEIKAGISGNLCRCTGYKKIIEAIQSVADQNKA
ncbi:(2Fe-2S)-binding protein [Fusibacter sp. 3D3]|uniref:(2Fe-2S)-binding protein n=1 Tax=Fusibacter sp. 3D3 TaxID=1048380 RepID=UPI000852DD30|nr:(2Fe-2S)-binding protein [Fusibacter sp. 3D3]GAU77088.1 xanthine dehydrogenase iron-sulfur subunit [Fusibacter sp. 3D3]